MEMKELEAKMGKIRKLREENAQSIEAATERLNDAQQRTGELQARYDGASLQVDYFVFLIDRKSVAYGHDVPALNEDLTCNAVSVVERLHLAVDKCGLGVETSCRSIYHPQPRSTATSQEIAGLLMVTWVVPTSQTNARGSHAIPC